MSDAVLGTEVVTQTDKNLVLRSPKSPRGHRCDTHNRNINTAVGELEQGENQSPLPEVTKLVIGRARTCLKVF